MSETATEGHPRWRRALRRGGYALLAVWIFGVAAFFYLRFTMVFYTANKDSIDSALKSLLEYLGVAP